MWWNPSLTEHVGIGETLKYFYLLFDDPNNWSLDDWVLNTEAHFFRRPDAKAHSSTAGTAGQAP
jgi:mannosyl-oligosaccharide alpha-1,2-mannosidase